jgi:simple sugar transport system permease protein
MFNWIAMFAVNLTINNLPMMLAKYWGGAQMDRTANLAQANPNALIPRLGLDTLMKSNYMNISIFIAVVFAIIAWMILSKTTFGYELKACGYNRNASVYAGINAKRNIVLSMVIAGAFSGLGGGLYFLAGTGQYTLLKQLLAAGFNGIPVALLASSNRRDYLLGILRFLYPGCGDAMQPTSSRDHRFIISVIIYLRRCTADEEKLTRCPCFVLGGGIRRTGGRAIRTRMERKRGAYELLADIISATILLMVPLLLVALAGMFPNAAASSTLR